jgi:hypothetical protein
MRAIRDVSLRLRGDDRGWCLGEPIVVARPALPRATIAGPDNSAALCFFGARFGR